MFSVLMSVYSGEKPAYFIRSLQSLVDQTIKIPEIILIIDGPVSFTIYRIIRYYRKLLRIKIIKNNNNLGLAKSLNIGLAHASNEIIFRFDTDDVCLPTRFQVQLEYFFKNNVDVLGCQILEFEDISLSLNRKRLVPCYLHDIKRSAKYRNPFNHMTIVFKKSVVLKYGGYPNIKYMEDYALWILLLVNNCKLSNLPNVLVYACAGKEMIKRRGGISYIFSEFKLQYFMYHLGFKNCFEAFFYFFIRSFVFMLPHPIKLFIYTYFLRSNI